MEAYVYKTENNIVIAKITGDDNQSIEAKYDECFDQDECGLTYSPAFGANEGLIIDGDFNVIDVSKQYNPI